MASIDEKLDDLDNPYWSELTDKMDALCEKP